MTAPDPASSGASDDEAEFAAFVADLVAHAHDPTEEGDQCRELLADDPEQLREAWAFTKIATAGGSPASSLSFLIVTLVVAAGLVIVMTVWMTSWLSSGLP